MIVDKQAMFADDLAHGGTVDYVDLGATRPGPGNPVKCFASGVSLAGATGLLVTDCDTSGGTYTDVVEIDVTSAELNAGGIEFELPSHIRQYVKVALVGTTSAGTWSAGVILPGFQSNT